MSRPVFPLAQVWQYRASLIAASEQRQAEEEAELARENAKIRHRVKAAKARNDADLTDEMVSLTLPALDDAWRVVRAWCVRCVIRECGAQVSKCQMRNVRCAIRSAHTRLLAEKACKCPSHATMLVMLSSYLNLAHDDPIRDLVRALLVPTPGHTGVAKAIDAA